MYYKHESVLLASKHQKEKAIAEVFFNKLSFTLCVQDFDTDQFGTFTGDIPRTLSPYDTCVLKARAAMAHYSYELGLASEGSFGPHPAIPFVPSAHEIMVFVDRKNEWTIAEELLCLKTNYNNILVNKETPLDEFLKQVGFPEHALILQTNTSKTVIAKGIRDLDTLHAALDQGFKKDNPLFLATDMRAMMNPTRMGTLKELADKLATRIATCCPKCEVPGFGFKKTQGNLPCSLCNASTSFYKQEVWGCIQCHYQEHHSRKDGLQEADPSHCDYCNP